MKTLNLYVGRQLLVSFLVTLLVLTFVMLSASVVQATKLLSQGLDLGLFFRFVVMNLPKVLGMTIPFALLASTILVFSRLSADHEVTAMRAGGVSLWQIILPGVLLSLTISGVCYYLQNELIPRGTYQTRMIRYASEVVNPRYILEPGRFIQAFDGVVIYIDDIEDGEKPGTYLLSEVHIYEVNGEEMVRDITAAKGVITHFPADQQFMLDLYQASIVNYKDGNPQKTNYLPAEKMTLPLSYAEQVRRRGISARDNALTMDNLLGRIQWHNSVNIDVMPLYMELHNRLVMSLAPLSFFLLAVPFGIRTSRTETSVGLVLSLVLGMVFYIFPLLADQMKSHPNLHPDILMWIPSVVYQIGGLWALRRISKR